jgi:hypothetical protein
MASIFKTTLKKEIIADIESNNKREIRFPITKFWAGRLSDEYNLDERTFKFKSFNSLEISSPSNKDTISERYLFTFVRTFVDGDEFVMEFKDDVGDTVESCVSDGAEMVEFESVVTEIVPETTIVSEPANDEPELVVTPDTEDDIDGSDMNFDEETNDEETNDEEVLYVSNEDVFNAIAEWFDEERIVDSLYESDSVFATNARQIIILPRGRVLGSKKILPVNNDVEVRVEFDMNKKVYFDPSLVIDFFASDIYRTLEEICKNNFVFIWKKYTGIFMDKEGRIYFGIKYSTRKSIGFNRKYNVQ